MGRAFYQRRLEELVARRNRADEQIQHWTRAWVSQVVRMQPFALRLRHFVVVTDERVLLVPVRFWTRRPAKRFGSLDITHIDVSNVRQRELRKLRVEVRGQAPLLLQFGRGRRDRVVARWLLEGPPGEASGATISEHPLGQDSTSAPVSASGASKLPSSTSDTYSDGETDVESAGETTDPPEPSSPTEAAQ